MSNDDNYKAKTMCWCEPCQLAVMAFYEDFLLHVKKLSPSDVSHKMMSQHRVMEYGYRMLIEFVNAIWTDNCTTTIYGDQLVDIWNVVKDISFCDYQVSVWKKQMIARKLIDE
jgi:hypothetical protein